jgi:hypothetical protein
MPVFCPISAFLLTGENAMLTDAKLRALQPRETLYRVADDKGLCV